MWSACRPITSRAQFIVGWVTSSPCMMCTALRIGASGLRSSCASIARNSFLRRSASCTTLYRRAFSIAIDARLANSRISAMRVESNSSSLPSSASAPRISSPASSGQMAAALPSRRHRWNCLSRITRSAAARSCGVNTSGSSARGAGCISSRRTPPSLSGMPRMARSPRMGTHRSRMAAMVSSRLSERDMRWLASDRKSERWMASSAAARAASERARASRAVACCCSWRFMRNSSTNTRTFERSTSGTTGDGM